MKSVVLRPLSNIHALLKSRLSHPRLSELLGAKSMEIGPEKAVSIIGKLRRMLGTCSSSRITSNSAK